MTFSRESLRASAAHPRASQLLGLVAFTESVVFPIPPDALLAPMCLSAPARAWRFAALATLFSVAGATAGYFIGQFFYDAAAGPLIAFYGLGQEVEDFRRNYDRYGLWIVLIGGLTPVPYKIVALTAGAAGMNLPLFVLAGLAARGGRFYALALVCRIAGPRAEALLKRAGGWSSALFFAALAALALIIALAAIL